MSGVRASPPVPNTSFDNMLTYVKESWEELKNNVTWLNRERATNLMVVVAVFSILFALATWGVDTVFSKLISLYFEYVIGLGDVRSTREKVVCGSCCQWPRE